jgi:secreted trypsin-like serine protease
MLPEDFISNPGYRRSSLINDIAVIRLSNAQFRFTNIEEGAVGSICLPNPAPRPDAGATITTAGWGITENPPTDGPHHIIRGEVHMSDPLKAVDTQVKDQADCQEYADREQPITPKPINLESRFCAFSPDMGQGPCNADSGGPAMMLKEGRYYVVGIVSFGKACGQGNLSRDFYTRVDSFLPWIISLKSSVENKT